MSVNVLYLGPHLKLSQRLNLAIQRRSVNVLYLGPHLKLWNILWKILGEWEVSMSFISDYILNCYAV